MAELENMRDEVYNGADAAYSATSNITDGSGTGSGSGGYAGGGSSSADSESSSRREGSCLADVTRILGNNPVLKKADGKMVASDLLIAGLADLLSKVSLGDTGGAREAANAVRNLMCPDHVPMLHLLRTPHFHRAVKLFVDHAHERSDFAPYQEFLAQFDAVMDSVKNDIDKCKLSGNFDLSEEVWDDPSFCAKRRAAVGQLLYRLMVRWTRSPALGGRGISFADYSLIQLGTIANLDHMTNRPGEAKSGIAVSAAAKRGKYPEVIDEAVQTEAVLAQDNARGKSAIATRQLWREASPYEKKRQDEKEEDDGDEENFCEGEEPSSEEDEDEQTFFTGDEGNESSGDEGELLPNDHEDDELFSDEDGGSSDDADDEESDDTDESDDDDDSDDDDGAAGTTSRNAKKKNRHKNRTPARTPGRSKRTRR